MLYNVCAHIKAQLLFNTYRSLIEYQPLARKTSSWSMQRSFRVALGFSFLNSATTYLERAAGSASQLEWGNTHWSVKVQVPGKTEASQTHSGSNLQNNHAFNLSTSFICITESMPMTYRLATLFLFNAHRSQCVTSSSLHPTS